MDKMWKSFYASQHNQFLYTSYFSCDLYLYTIISSGGSRILQRGYHVVRVLKPHPVNYIIIIICTRARMTTCRVYVRMRTLSKFVVDNRCVGAI